MITVVDSPHFFELYSSKNDVGEEPRLPVSAVLPRDSSGRREEQEASCSAGSLTMGGRGS